MKRHLITSAIPYVNGVKHLGNLVGSMLPADVFARFCRQSGHETLFICGTDDHGTPAELGAIKEKQNPAEYVAKWHDFQADIYNRFGLSFDWFGSSSRPQNHALTQHLARKLQANSLLDVRTERMLYSKADDRFLPDRYVEGTCPKCKFPKARGDQCDGCGSVLDPTDLINPYSSISGSTDLELRDSNHLYLKQSTLVPQLRAFIDKQTHWPKLSRSIAYKWLDEGLQDRGITRDMKWGVKVPVDTFGDAFASKVFYVWFDAPIAYIAATEEWANAQGYRTPTPSSKPAAAGLSSEALAKEDGAVPLSAPAARWWRNDMGAADVTYTEFMGKDNVYFHTLSFPSTLIGSGEPWKLVHTLKSYNWLTYYGGKFSTSMNVGIFTDKALELLPADYWRYYLLARAPEGDDAEFRWPEMQSVVNKDLADVLGNFVNRTLTFTAKHFGNTIPPMGELTEAEDKLAEDIAARVAKITEHMANADMRKSVETLRECWVLGNEYLATQEPWQTIKTDKPRAATVLATAIALIPLYARLMAPIIPFTATKLMACFEANEDNAECGVIPAATKAVGQTPLPIPAAGLPTTLHTPWPWPKADDIADLLGFPPSGTFTVPAPIIPKITDDQVTEWEALFGNKKV
ncbi:MAG: methionine--tRNA ligase [Alphaproteobacteria bacterium]